MAKCFCERTLQTMIEICIDVANFIIKEKRLGLPAEEESAFEQLYEAKIISEEMTKTLKNMKKFRNILVHHYVEIKDNLVYQYATQRRSDFLDFKQEILSFLKEQK